MLVLTRKVGESIVIGERIRLTVTALEGDRVRLGIEAPRELSILRAELYDAVREENRAAASAGLEGRELAEKLAELLPPAGEEGEGGPGEG